MPEKRLPRISLLVAPESSPSVLYGLYDVLHSAGVEFSDLTIGEPGDKMIDVGIVSASGEPFRCWGDVLVEPKAGVEDVLETDVALVCDMYTPINVSPLGRYPAEMAWLRRMYDKGAIIASVCSGSLVLAEAGLLDGLEASGHWAYREVFREYFPEVRLRDNAILTLAGEDERIVTAGGVTSWQDLAIYLITRLCGPEAAIKAAKVHIIAGHSDGQLPFAAMARLLQQSDAVIGDCQTWIAQNYSKPNPVAQMAERSGLKPRTFTRRFRAATGYQPMEYVHAIRIEEAKQLLETEDANIEDVGHQVGYEDPAFFRRLFRRKAGLTPAGYRKRFARLAAGQSFR
jgi:transcriptional regulator GlxA family with amidase domain